MLDRVVLGLVAAALVCAGLYDLWVLRKYGIESGKTISWQLYTDARNWPALAFLAGLVVALVLQATGTSPIVALFLLVAGHVFGTMRGAS